MAIAHDAVTVSAADYTATGTQTTAHVASSTARAACVIITMVGTADQVSGVTYNGTSMTRLRFDTDTFEAGSVYIYWLDNITPGPTSRNVVMTTTGTAAKRLSVSTMTTTNGNAVVVAGNNSATLDASANPTVTISGLTSGSTLSAYLGVHSGLQAMTTTPGTNWTNIVNADRGTTGYGQARQQVASSGTTLVCDWIGGSDDYVISAVAFKQDIPIQSASASVTMTPTVTAEAELSKPVSASVSMSPIVSATAAVSSSQQALNTTMTPTSSATGLITRVGDAATTMTPISSATATVQKFASADPTIMTPISTASGLIAGMGQREFWGFIPIN